MSGTNILHKCGTPFRKLDHFLKNCTASAKCSMLLMGLGQIRNKQVGKGILLILAEIAFIAYFALIGVTDVIGLFTLGTKAGDPILGIAGDNSITMLIRGVLAVVVLLFLAFAMFCSYIFMDILSPIKDLMQSTRGWDSTAFGTMQGAETFLNVFVFFLIFAGIILDKMGVRFTAVLSGAVMLVGATINWYAVTEAFQGSGLERWFTENLNYIPGFDELGISPFYEGMPASAKLAAIGFMIFGCGVEMAGITVSRGIVKWFKGREMALAMGSEMALARLGVATCMIFSPVFARMGGDIDVSRSVAFGVVLLMIAFIMFVVYFFMDKRLDAQTGEAEEKDDPFKVSDIGKILTSSGFWLVALLCVLYYSAIFPFQKYAVNMLQCNLTFTEVDPGSFWGS